ncbi:MAG TPA: response regulator transcription factor [Gemmatimonadaceae bacterium]|jgi:DNA-binding NarL/FixJ family response regulator|nr:response regulator transcription factor [Gemmatimonadaceae bacterium]
MIRILIVDDHPIVRAGLRRIAEDDRGIVVTAEAPSGDEALVALTHSVADVVLLDVSMPGSPFTETLRRLRESHPTVRILVLSAHPEDQWAVRALRGGASGYLTKDHSPEQLLDAIRRVHRGGRYVSPTLAERLAAQLGQDFVGAPHEQLSDREFDVLRGLGMGRSVKEVASELGLSPKTVSTYRTRLMEKLGFATNADLVRYSMEHGLIQFASPRAT